MRLLLISGISILVLSAAAFGDVVGHHPVRKPRQSGKPMVIQIDPEATTATLKIPRPMLKQFLAEAGGIDEGDANRGEANSGASVRTVVAGICLSLAAVIGGLSFWRFRGKLSQGTDTGSTRQVLGLIGAILSIAALTGWLVTVSRADVRVPPRLVNAPLKVDLPNGRPVTGLVNIQIVSEGDQIVLSVPGPKPSPSDDDDE